MSASLGSVSLGVFLSLYFPHIPWIQSSQEADSAAHHRATGTCVMSTQPNWSERIELNQARRRWKLFPEPNGTPIGSVHWEWKCHPAGSRWKQLEPRKITKNCWSIEMIFPWSFPWSFPIGGQKYECLRVVRKVYRGNQEKKVRKH